MNRRAIGLVASAMLGTPRLFRARQQANYSALLFHRFFADGEARGTGVDRLRRQLDWLRSSFVPVSLDRFISGRADGSLPDRAVLVTTDDAHRDVLDAAPEFAAFEVPFTVFVCAGWSAASSRGTGEDLLARAVSSIQWFEGAPAQVRFGRHAMHLSPHETAANIDRLLTIAERSPADLTPAELIELCEGIEALQTKRSEVCTWAELRDLARSGTVGIGAHSVSHIKLSQASPRRRGFEIAESKRLCDALIGSCEAFAYPYGTDDAHSADTRATLEEAGFSTAFLTHSDFITTRGDRLLLPRFSMPDEPMGLREFQARAQGAGIVARRIKTAIRGPA